MLLEALGPLAARGQVVWGQFAVKKILSHSCQTGLLTQERIAQLMWSRKETFFTYKGDLNAVECLNTNSDTRAKPAPHSLKL